LHVIAGSYNQQAEIKNTHIWQECSVLGFASDVWRGPSQLKAQEEINS
jgi:hypothetical protein